MKITTETIKLWTCPKCGRKFERQGQSHSCRAFPLEQHFAGKPAGRLLYEKFRKAVAMQVGAFKIESLECCIHFVSTSTFVAVKVFRNKIRVDFSLSHAIKSKRVSQSYQMSPHRQLYGIDILKEDEIDATLLEWVQEAHDKKRAKMALHTPQPKPQ